MRVLMYLAIESAIKNITQRKKNPPEHFKAALSRLYRAIEAIDMKEGPIYVGSNEDVDTEQTLLSEKLAEFALNSVDEMISFSLSPDEPSIKKLLETEGLLQHFANTIKSNSNAKYFISPTLTPQDLCQFAVEGDLEKIKQHFITPDLVDEIISSTKNSGPELYMGKYNALMIAIAYRHTPIVKYFIEKLGATLDIKGGRRKDLSILDCAGQPGNCYFLYAISFFPPVDAKLQEYLREKLNPKATLSSSHAAVSVDTVENRTLLHS